MNPRQRRGVLLMGLAGVAGLVVFLSVSSYVAEVSSQVGPMARSYGWSATLFRTSRSPPTCSRPFRSRSGGCPRTRSGPPRAPTGW
jgi:hypothetical protein